MANLSFLALLFVVLPCVLLIIDESTVASGAKIIRKGSKDWSAVDWDKLESDWSEDDEDEEKKSEDEFLMEEMERKKAQFESQEAPDVRRLQKMHPKQAEQMLANSQAGNQGGPTMMFIDLKPGEGMNGVSEDGSARTWPKSDLDILSTQWRDLLMTAGFQTSIYNIEGDRLLVSVQKGWNGEDVKNFFLTRTEVNMVTWNNVETRASEFAEF
ncbi:hypothetical protein TrRE_jg7227 [Triparma retinervis]|uniref:Mesoderm development candidate 2 n=1 Tax=Triparma retinervis TaxID=2557542 RepID=A0A9W7CGE9_9STRA|nr:hypothetical protein TrRE_jg7227 [Triparma retinervis]